MKGVIKYVRDLTSQITPDEKDMRGVKIEREFCIGQITDDYIWLEVCDPNRSDFRLQYCVPQRHYKYTDEQLERLAELSKDDRNIYNVTLKCDNKDGTAWLFDSMEYVEDLPSGYRKNTLSI